VPSPGPTPLTVLIVVPTLQAGASEAGAVELARILAAAGHRPIVVSRGGRMEPDVVAAGGELVRANMASKNPLVMLGNAGTIARLIRKRHCNVVHAHGRAPAWSAYLAARAAGVPFLTTWYKGFREQNRLKRLYNSVMARGDRVIAPSEQIAELINERYGTSWDRIAVVPAAIDISRFDPSTVTPERVAAVRAAWGTDPNTRVIVVVGRMLRRKGHHTVVDAACRLKQMGLKNFLCVFIGEDGGQTRYAGELWDQVLATKTADVIRLAGPPADLPAAYAAATVAVSAAVQAEGVQHAVLEAEAMGRPVVVSDLGAGPDVVLAPPAVPEERMTGLRFSAGDDAALAAALVRLFSMPEAARLAMGARGRDWMVNHFNAPSVAEQTLRLYSDLMQQRARR
jgi:glycosyltransferase involved in cell wall biosynthesis